MSLHNQVENILNFDLPFISQIKPTDWAEQNRVMTSDTSPYPGKFKMDRTPYWREVLDTLSPEHPMRKCALMKGAQIGASTNIIENGIGYIISQQPGTIILAAQTEDMVKSMMETKVEQMLHSCELSKFIRPAIIRAKNSRTGDTSLSKEFPGGWLKAYSIANPGKMRQISGKYAFLDDFEAAPSSKKAGNAAALFETRGKGYANNGMKYFFISTPEIQQTSNIEPLYMQGDQRRYYIPCPCCGEFITIEWKVKTDFGKAGVTYKVNNKGYVVKGSVGYICQSCGEFFDDRHKHKLLNEGHWTPTAEPSEDGFYSYQISALYAPVGMANWENYAIDYNRCCPVDGKLDADSYKTFVNTVLGKTWIERGDKPDAKGIALNTRGYKVGVVPQEKSREDGNGEIVLITCGIDLGGTVYNETKGTVDDARIDYEIVAWSENGSPYSISHGSCGTFIPLEGNKKIKVDRVKYSYNRNAPNSVWVLLDNVLGSVLPTDNGGSFQISCSAIDTGHFTHFAYDYIDNSQFNIVSIKGASKDGRFDEDTPYFKFAKERPNLYILNGNKIKDDLSSTMKLKWDESGGQPVGFMNYPQPSDGKYTYTDYFSHYEAEQRVVNTSKTAGTSSYKWEKRNSAVQNHLWDCRVYNMAMRDIQVYHSCKAEKAFNSWANFCAIMKRHM